MFSQIKRVLGTTLMTTIVLVFSGLTHLCEAAPATAKPIQNLAALRDNVEQFLTQQTQDLPGKVAISVASFDSRLALADCLSLDIFLSGNNRPWGKTSVGVRCLSPIRWTVYVQAHVSVIGDYVVSTASLQQGQLIQAKDVMLQMGDLTALPPGALTQVKDATQRILKTPVKPGAVIKADIIAFPIIVQQGQRIRIVTAGEGFTLSTEGLALNSAAVGEAVRARVASGQTIQGMAKENGQVEVALK